MRKQFWWTLVVMTIGIVSASARMESVQVNLDYVAKKALLRAAKPFKSPRGELPVVLSQDNLDYDKYREIQFRHDNALWARDELPFRVEFFHPGYLYQEPIYVHEFTLTHAQSIPFVQDFFNYGGLKIQKKIPANTGYAGFKILYPLNERNKWDELGSFLGASYFRLLGKNQRYGQSARGLAVDCGETDRPEEFPIFTEWWLGKPHKDDSSLRLYAILDSVSCVGAYEFVIQPGDTTSAEVEAVVYLRTDAQVKAVNPQRLPMKTIGVAPLTSMFWFGPASERRFDDYRVQVHDSDGLLMRMDNGELLWRPLANPRQMNHQAFATRDIRGFGLMQRAREFSDYEDMFNEYHRVPSAWVVPHDDWGEGAVHLVELSTIYEGLDNIVAFWDPKEKPAPMQPFRFGYTLMWTLETDHNLSPERVVSTRIGLDARDARKRKFAIDFDGPKLDSITDGAVPIAVTSCSDNAVIVEKQVFRNTHAGTWRVVLGFQPKTEPSSPVDLRCTLQRDGKNISETWTYHWTTP